jgi:hypothetical protein
MLAKEYKLVNITSFMEKMQKEHFDVHTLKENPKLLSS